ncbi:hypothetical protein Hokovirus_2_109 [Hokovirus HKV1]|uniref:Uncharacterized protein n=1 Tax=Hokovirus HKV1 TaxID=1977638 RepID=A0A1V0SFT8_9VIRU|nr:hypothetical protein Hokovirus_2_109 [Hokovirus HKV1]
MEVTEIGTNWCTVKYEGRETYFAIHVKEINDRIIRFYLFEDGFEIFFYRVGTLQPHDKITIERLFARGKDLDNLIFEITFKVKNEFREFVKTKEIGISFFTEFEINNPHIKYPNFLY